MEVVLTGRGFSIRRTRVPGGWLYVTERSTSNGVAVATTFVPEPNGE
jgi:hypothetical protein